MQRLQRKKKKTIQKKEMTRPQVLRLPNNLGKAGLPKPKRVMKEPASATVFKRPAAKAKKMKRNRKEQPQKEKQMMGKRRRKRERPRRSSRRRQARKTRARETRQRRKTRQTRTARQRRTTRKRRRILRRRKIHRNVMKSEPKLCSWIQKTVVKRMLKQS